ncbi:tyrosine-type recombinase/integrase [Amycolatopsis thermophila]|uniref:Integrase n=1 Tax=Amycolatopsis thermophila TaxID=206084 RepID=A0ABU0EMG9_9PSEU|nr:site-specific integrase [Amycolatopsis thermophila]MDQ0376466.1 integrase [Amycolatopsis thermophila]
MGYRVTWRDPDTRRKDSLTFDDPEDAKRLKKLLDANGQRLVEAQKVMASIKNQVPTIAELIEHHIEHLTGVQPRTKRDYRRDAKRHINPHLGAIPVDALDRDRVKRWVNDLTGKMSGKTLANVHSLLSAALQESIPKWREDNPAKGIRMPQHVPEEAVFLTPGEFNLLLAKVRAPYRLFIKFLASTGLRWGEAVVLTPDDFNLLNPTPTVRVSKALKEDANGRDVVGVPKSRKSVRTVSLPASLVPELSLEMIGKASDDLVFTGPQGGQLRNNHFWERVWLPAVNAANADIDKQGRPFPRELRLNKNPRIHDLRHTHASWMIAAGVDLPTLQRRLGHESIKTTVDRYGHLLPDQLKKAAEAAEATLSGALAG